MFNKAQVAIANVKKIIDVIASELVWSVVDPKVSIWCDRRGRPTEWRYLKTVRADNPEEQSLLCFRLTENRT